MTSEDDKLSFTEFLRKEKFFLGGKAKNIFTESCQPLLLK